MRADLLMLPVSAIEAVIGRAFAVCTNAEQRAEAVEWVEAPVKAEGKFVEVGLQVLGIDPSMVRPLQPSLEVAENKVNDRQVFFGNLRIAALDYGQVLIAPRAERVVGRSRIGHDNCANRYSGLDKAAQSLLGAIRNNLNAKPPGVSTATIRAGWCARWKCFTERANRLANCNSSGLTMSRRTPRLQCSA